MSHSAVELELAVGSDITYCLLVSNNGETVLSDIVVTDDAVSFSDTIATLAVGETRLLTASASLDATLINVASVEAKSPTGQMVLDEDTARVVPLFPSIRIVKTVSDTGTCPGVGLPVPQTGR